MNRNLSIRLPNDLRRELFRCAQQQGCPASEVAREALRRYLATHQIRDLRKRLRPYAEARGFLTDDDVFEAVS